MIMILLSISTAVIMARLLHIILLLTVFIMISAETVEIVHHQTYSNNNPMLEMMPPFVQSMVPVEMRTGTLGLAIGSFIITTGLFAFLPLTYFFGYILGRFFLAPTAWSVLPWPIRPSYARSLETDDTMLDDLSAGVTAAINTFHMIQKMKNNNN